MKFRFKIQQYQTDAVESVVRVFRGQHYSDGITYNRDLGEQKPMLPPPEVEQLRLFPAAQVAMDDPLDDTGYKNDALRLTGDELLANIRAVQGENNLHMSDKLDMTMGCPSLDVEMETGTGKTYVYIKTMFELNKRYGFSKFIVVVPSIAIREGVKKSFEITTDHFMELYGKKARFFIYNSANLNQLDAFSSDSGINVMIINTQAFAASLKEDGRSKEARIIYSQRDEFASRRPIDVIAANRPIIILDEPQKMGGDVTQKAIQSFHPLFCLNYSATHAKQHNLVYVLDALDAYNKRLVKKIEVKGFEVKNFRGTDQYLYMESIILSPKKPPQVRMELEVRYQKSINREFRLLGAGDNLYFISNEMEQYNSPTADTDVITISTQSRMALQKMQLRSFSEHDLHEGAVCVQIAGQLVLIEFCHHGIQKLLRFLSNMERLLILELARDLILIEQNVLMRVALDGLHFYKACCAHLLIAAVALVLFHDIGEHIQIAALRGPLLCFQELKNLLRFFLQCVQLLVHTDQRRGNRHRHRIKRNDSIRRRCHRQSIFQQIKTHASHNSGTTLRLDAGDVARKPQPSINHGTVNTLGPDSGKHRSVHCDMGGHGLGNGAGGFGKRGKRCAQCRQLHQRKLLIPVQINIGCLINREILAR